MAYRSGVEEWGLSGGVRLEPRANGRGLSLSVEPGWGEAGSGVSRLWEEGMAGRGETAEEGSGAVVEAEVGYGVGAFGGFGVVTPYTRFGQAREERRYGLGWRLSGGSEDGFALDLGVWRRERATERAEHGVGLGPAPALVGAGAAPGSAGSATAPVLDRPPPRESGGSEPVRSVASRSSSDDDPGPRATGPLLVGVTSSLQAHVSLDKTYMDSILDSG